MHCRCERCVLHWAAAEVFSGNAQSLTRASGNLKQLNELARNAKADYIIHTGDFGFYDESSLDRIAEK